MRDINIQIHNNHTVDFENDYAGLNEENLQGNITFNFDNFVSGQARAEIVINNVCGYILLDQVGQTYTLPIKSSLLTGEDILMQLVIEQEPIYKKTLDTEIVQGKIYLEKVGDNYVIVDNPVEEDLGNYYEEEVPIWKSEIFYLKVGNSINAEITIPDEYPSWVEVVNGILNQLTTDVDDLQTNKQDTLVSGTNIKTINNISILGSGNIDIGGGGISTDVQINGESITEEGVANILTNGEYSSTNKIATMSDIPTVNNATLTIQKNETQIGTFSANSDTNTTINIEVPTNNNQLENGAGYITSSALPDLTDYVKNTDYATNSTGGVFKTATKFSTGMGSGENEGLLLSAVKSYSDYSSLSQYSFISKGTLENVITGKGLTTKSYVDGLVGDISSVIDAINGESI